MKKFLLGVLSGVLLVLCFGAFLALVFLAMGGGSVSADIPDDSVLTIELSGNVPEHLATDFAFEYFERGGPPPTVLGLRKLLEAAAEDDRIRAVYLDCGGLGAGWARAQEIRWAIEEFKRSGKPVFAYMQVAGTMDYVVASAADHVFLFPEGVLDMKGLRAEVSFYKDTLDKIGVEAELERIGDYKSAAEPYSRSSMSDAFREVTNSMLDELLRQLLDTLAPSRDMTPDQLRAALDEGPFLPQPAVELGLVDELLYPDQVADRIKETLDLEEFHEVNLRRYGRANPDALGTSGSRVAVVYGIGSIVRGKTRPDPFSGSQILGSDTFSEVLSQVGDDDKIRAVILRIDSPGGDAIASDQMWRDLARLREKKPVVVSMGDVAASGGYYMAMASGVPVIAYPGTITGSIGVFFGKINLRGLYDKIGLKKEILTRGRFAAIDTDYRSLTEEERAKVREGVEAVYQSFVEKVAAARGVEWDAIDKVAQGRVWMGTQALEVGLVDELGGFESAIARVKREAEIDQAEEIQLVTYPKPKNFLELIFETGGFAAAPPAIPAQVSERLGLDALLPALSAGGMLALTPYSVQIR